MNRSGRSKGVELYDFLVTGDAADQPAYSPEGLPEADHSMDKFDIPLLIAKELCGRGRQILFFSFATFLPGNAAVNVLQYPCPKGKAPRKGKPSRRKNAVRTLKAKPASAAQTAERRSLKPTVAGPNPAGCTKSTDSNYSYHFKAQLRVRIPPAGMP